MVQRVTEEAEVSVGIQVKDDGGLDQGGSGEKWLDLDIYLKVKQWELMLD